jgi:hypothetical protein
MQCFPFFFWYLLSSVRTLAGSTQAILSKITTIPTTLSGQLDQLKLWFGTHHIKQPRSHSTISTSHLRMTQSHLCKVSNRTVHRHYVLLSDIEQSSKDVVGFQYVWVVNVSSFDLSASNISRVFYFGVNTRDSSGSSAHALSHYINITDASAITTSSSITSSISTSSTAPASTTTTHVQTMPSTKSQSLSGGAIAGIVIGLIAALATLAALGRFIWIFRRNRQSIGSSEMQTTSWQKAELDAGTSSNMGAHNFENGGPLGEQDGGLHELEAP